MVASEADLSVAAGAAAFQEKCSWIEVEIGVVCFSAWQGNLGKLLAQ